MNRGADYVEFFVPALAPEQGTRPDTANRTIKLRLLARPTVPVSTAIMQEYVRIFAIVEERWIRPGYSMNLEGALNGK